MANIYNFTIIQGFGTGNISVNGDLISTNGLQGSVFVEAGTTVTIDVDPDPGYTSFSALVVGGPYTSSPFTFTFPEQDLFMAVDFFGTFTPVDGYQLKYFWDYKANGNEDRRLEIYEDDFDGVATERQIQNLSYVWGNMDADPVSETFVRSKITFDIAGEPNDFQEFLTGNNRKFKAVYYHGLDVIFTGFVTTDTLVMPEKAGVIIMRFEALDGMRSFDSIRLIPQRAPFVTGAIRYIVGALNQTFVEHKPINISVDLYETRMDSDDCLFEQFDTPFNAFYTDGRDAVFTDGTRISNQFQFIKDFLTRIVNPFMARIFLYKDEWYIIRLSEHQKASQRFFKYDPDGTLDDEYDLTNPYELACDFETDQDGEETYAMSKFGNAERTARLVFNEFTAILKLGVLSPSSAGGLFESKFNIDDFFQAFGVNGIAPGTWVLRPYWSKTNAQYVNSAIYGDTAGLQYVSSDSEFLQISSTSSNAGFSDPNLSWIELTTQSSGVGIPVSQELANTLSIGLEFAVVRRDDTVSLNITGTTFAMRVKVGNFYLERVGATGFDWTLTPTNMVFDIPVINSYPDYVTHIGDALTNNSSSAIRLIPSNDVSRLWSRDGVEEAELLDILVQELANFKGRKNLRILGTQYKGFPDVRKGIEYDGSRWVVTYFNHDSARNETKIELFQIDE
jgi:hypothetical protein